ncbi:MAG: JAB domain-containing protein, partial [Leptospiraceae bacterium]|nr:JAB domain-containing protein [Leptospiraceae bacterium]
RRRGLIDWHVMGTGGYDRVEVYYRDLLRTILNDRAGIVVIAHNHPGESARPGMDDLSSMRNLERMLSDIGVALQDQFIIGEDGVYSCRQKRFLQQNHFQKN